MAADRSKEPEQDKLPPQGVRTLLSFLIFIHLFLLAVTVGAHFGTVSGLLANLRRVQIGGVQPFVVYLDTLRMDLGYNFHFTHNLRDDFDHFCDILLDTPDGFAGTPAEIEQLERLTMMPENAWPGIRRQRYLNLAHATARWAESPEEENQSVLPRSIAGGILRQHDIGGTRHRFRCRVQFVPGMLELEELEPELRSAEHSDYFADITRYDLVPVGESWAVNKVATRAETTQRRSGGR